MSLINLTIDSREKDLGGFTVRRLLPYAKKRMVGPFIFLDHMGPADFGPGHGIDVRPHPHIGLSTLTYLFSGSMYHRDSLGFDQEITAGAVNWMTAGSGISHSERSSAQQRATQQTLNGMQSWIALPKGAEEINPSFHHHPQSSIPHFSDGQVQLTLVAGRAYGYESPVHVYSPLCYLEVCMPQGSCFTLPKEYAERAIYIVEGAVRIGQEKRCATQLVVCEPSQTITIEAPYASRLVVLAGDPFAEKRFIWWNLVSSSKERIEQAMDDWHKGRFTPVVGDENERIPLPQMPL